MCSRSQHTRAGVQPVPGNLTTITSPRVGGDLCWHWCPAARPGESGTSGLRAVKRCSWAPVLRHGRHAASTWTSSKRGSSCAGVVVARLLDGLPASQRRRAADARSRSSTQHSQRFTLSERAHRADELAETHLHTLGQPGGDVCLVTARDVEGGGASSDVALGDRSGALAS